MGDIQPARNFLMEIQGQPDFVYTADTVKFYSQVKERVLQLNPIHPQQQQRQQLLKQIADLQDLIQDYQHEINEAIAYLPAVTETEKRHLQFAYHHIKKTEQQVQALLAQA
jgi:hypothetical protein